MDMGLFRGLVTVILFIAYCLLLFRTFSKRHKAEYDKAALMPLEENARPVVSTQEDTAHD